MKSSLLLISLFFTGFAQAGCLPDVVNSLQNLTPKATPIMTDTNGQFDQGSYRQSLKTKWGFNNHIQGIVQIPQSSLLILSGGDVYQKKASLFVVDVTSSTGKFLHHENIGIGNFWHAGGLAMVDHLLAVPVEDSEVSHSSKILFYDFSQPLKPIKLSVEIIREKTITGSVSMYRDEAGHLVVGTNSYGVMEFFKSKTQDIQDGFESVNLLGTQVLGQGQSIVEQCDGKKFMIDLDNSSLLAPILPGKNMIRLFSLSEDLKTVQLISQKRVKSRGHCNFKAAGAASVRDGKLSVVGSAFYRIKGGDKFKLCQFSEL